MSKPLKLLVDENLNNAMMNGCRVDLHPAEEVASDMVEKTDIYDLFFKNMETEDAVRDITPLIKDWQLRYAKWQTENGATKH